MQITGTLKVIGATQTIGANFQKREFVIVTPEQYPQSIQLEFQGDKCNIIDAYAEGQEVVCDINIRGRLWTNPEGVDKYFNTLVCWKIQPIKSEN
jgi:single-strand DNA-binding protein